MGFDSGINGKKRIDILQIAANTFIDLVYPDNAVGIVSFDQDPHDVMPIEVVGAEIYGSGRINAKTAINNFDYNEYGTTSIGDGVEIAHSYLDPVTGYDVKAIIVLTDGHENTEKYISEVMDLINERVYAIGLGTAQAIQPSALDALTNNTGGYLLMTGDLGQDDIFKLTKYYLQILAGVTNADIVLDPEGWISPGSEVKIPFDLTEADVDCDVILLTPYPDVVAFSLETPQGQIITSGTAASNQMITYAKGNQVSYYRISLPIVLEDKLIREGQWNAILRVDDEYFKKYVSRLAETDKPAYQRADAHGVQYNLSVQVHSNLRMNNALVQDSFEPSGTIHIRSNIAQYMIPLKNRVKMSAELTRPDKTSSTIILEESEPGIFESKTEAMMPGIYTYKIKASGMSLNNRRFTREQILTASIWKGGDSQVQIPTDRCKNLICSLLKCILSEKNLTTEFKKHLDNIGINLDGIRDCVHKLCDSEVQEKPSKIDLTELGKIVSPDVMKKLMTLRNID